MTDRIDLSPGELPPDLLLRYVAGRATDAERRHVAAHVAMHGPEALDAARAIWAAASDPVPPGDVDRFVARLRHGIAEDRVARSRPIPAVRSAVRWARPAGALAAAVLVAAAGWTVLRHAVFPAPAAPERYYATTTGQQATITLDDGSRVTLAPESRLTVSGRFGRDDRTLTLDGEAYFTVASHQGAPFVVRTRSGETRVLGTAFDVRQYATDLLMHVAVMQGKVAVGRHVRDREPVTVPAGFIAMLGNEMTWLTGMSDSAEYTAWKDGRLVFTDASVADMLATVGRWYGYQFRLADSTLATQHVTATIKLNGDTALVLRSLKSLLEVTMTFDGPVVTLSRRKEALSSRPRPLERDAFSHSSEIGK